MDPCVDGAIAQLEGQGFGRLERALPAELVAELRSIAARLAQGRARPWSASLDWHRTERWDTALFNGEGHNRVLLDCLGADPALDRAVECFVQLPQVRALLDHVVGEERRIWFVQLRWARAGAEEYPLHQDVYGELALCAYLDDHPDPSGSMVYWPGSHRWPRAIRSDVPLEPRWSGGRAVHVPGRAGDLCAFFNKTWHGRTSAEAGERLVFLISFIPPGPIDRPRRATPTARAGLGAELSRVTAPDAALSFGDRPPPEPRLSTRIETPAEPLSAGCTFADYGRRATLDYAWRCARARVQHEPSEPAPPETLAAYAALVGQAVGRADYPRTVAAWLVDDLAVRAGNRGCGRRAVARLRAAQALGRGDLRAAATARAEWLAAERDWLCGDEADELDALIEVHAALGDDELALDGAGPLLEGALAGEGVPDRTWALLLAPLTRLGRMEDAARCHDRGARALAELSARTDRWALHLDYLSDRGESSRAVELVGALAEVAVRPAELARGNYWRAAARALAALDDPDNTIIEAVDPRPDPSGQRPRSRASAAHFARRFAAFAAGLEAAGRTTGRQ